VDIINKMTAKEYRRKLFRERGYVNEELVKKFIENNTPESDITKNGKYCRLGKRICNEYRGCRDICYVCNKYVTSLKKCPK
jgi:hypothetical protein